MIRYGLQRLLLPKRGFIFLFSEGFSRIHFLLDATYYYGLVRRHWRFGVYYISDCDGVKASGLFGFR